MTAGTGDRSRFSSSGTGDRSGFYHCGTGDRSGLLIVCATGNEHKLGEFRQIIVDALPENIFDMMSQKTAAKIVGAAYCSPEETGSTFGENAYIKAAALEKFIFESESFREYAEGYSATCVIADDSGLCVDALGGAPGVYSARYASDPGSFEDADDAKNVEKLLKNMENVAEEMRTARFECHITALLRSGNAPGYTCVRIETSGDLKGRITHETKGTGGFGYDPVLYIPELGKTTAMLSPEEKNKISHRGRALRKAAETIYDCLRKL